MLCLQVLKFFHHLGKKLHNLNKLNNKCEKQLKFHTKGTGNGRYYLFTNAKVLHHLGEKSHNFEQVEQLM